MGGISGVLLSDAELNALMTKMSNEDGNLSLAEFAAQLDKCDALMAQENDKVKICRHA